MITAEELARAIYAAHREERIRAGAENVATWWASEKNQAHWIAVAAAIIPFIQSRAAGVKCEYCSGHGAIGLGENSDVCPVCTPRATPQPPKDAGAVPDGFVIVPRDLTSENGAKAEFMGEKFDGVAVSWTGVKAVHRAIVKWAGSLPQHPPAEPETTAADNDIVQVERGLLGAACSAIAKKRDAPKVLEALRKITMTPRAEPAARAQVAVGECNRDCDCVGECKAGIETRSSAPIPQALTAVGDGGEVVADPCADCKGSGEVGGLLRHPSGDPQDDYEGTIPCPRCEGAAVARPVADAEALKIEPTHCRCHPETCPHGDYTLSIGEKKITDGSKAQMLEIVAALGRLKDAAHD